MSNRWRIVNPALVPAQVVAESSDEQVILRQCATRDPSDGLKLLKSEDDGKTWVEVEARAPDAAARPDESAHGGWKPPPEEPLKGIKPASSSELERGELGGSSGATEHAAAETRSKKASK